MFIVNYVAPIIKVKKFIINDPAVIMFYVSTTGKTKKVVAVAKHGDKFDKEIGERICMLKMYKREIELELRKY